MSQREPMDFDYLSRHLERAPTVSARQHYVQRILENPRTTRHGRDEVLVFIRRRPDLFVPYDEVNGTMIENEIARKKNGSDARGDFRFWVLSKYAS